MFLQLHVLSYGIIVPSFHALLCIQNMTGVTDCT